MLFLHAVSQQTQASPPSFNPETSSCKEVCKRCWANSMPVQQLFCHWSATGTLSTLWSSQELISSPLLDFLIHLLLSLSLQKLFHNYSEEEKTRSPFSSIRSHLSQREAVRIRPEIFLPSAQIFSLGEHVKPVIFLVLPFQRGLGKER